MALSRRDAAQEYWRRRQLRRSLVNFARECGFEPAPHHKLIIDHLEKVARGEVDRLIITAPPGSAKSTYVSVLFPAWLLANNNVASILAASHTSELAERWGRQVRNLVAERSAELGISLSPDSQAAGRWRLDTGGEYLATGVGGAILGFRSDVSIIDDPVRSREDAASETLRRNHREWFSSDLRTRLKPGGRIIIVSTRWHEEDLVGWLLDKAANGGERWTRLNLPAIAEDNDVLGRQPGELLWDDDYGYAEFLRREHQVQTPMVWASLYQQRPAPETGDFFKAEWLKPYEKAPARELMRCYGASDYAVTAGGGDYTVHIVVGVDPQNRIYLLDMWRGRTASDVWVEKMLDLVKLWSPMSWAEETGQIRSGVGPLIDKRSRERRVYVHRQAFPTKYDKAVRAQAIRGRMAFDGLHVPVKAHWYPAFLQELLGFPNAKHDDAVDALGLVGQMLATMVGGTKPPSPRVKNLDDYVEIDQFNMGRNFENLAWIDDPTPANDWV
jgi:predicted phage terminase large subunit-like protein